MPEDNQSLFISQSIVEETFQICVWFKKKNKKQKNSVQSTVSDEILLTSTLPYTPVKTIAKNITDIHLTPLTYQYMYTYVLEIQMMSGGLAGCVHYILYSTVVV